MEFFLNPVMPTNQLEYLRWRRRWKSEYKKLTQMIQNAKESRVKFFELSDGNVVETLYNEYYTPDATQVAAVYSQIASKAMALLADAKIAARRRAEEDYALEIAGQRSTRRAVFAPPVAS